MVSYYKEKRSVLSSWYALKTRRFIAAILLVISFLFVIACGESSKIIPVQSTGGTMSIIGTSGTGGSGGFQTVDTGVPSPPQVSGGTGGIAVTGGSGGIAVTGGSGGTGGVIEPEDASILDPFDSGIGDGNVIDPVEAGALDTTVAADTSTQTDTGLPPGTCCADGNCICRDDPPATLSSDDGPYRTDSYDLRGVGCVYYPTDADPPFSAVAISDGFLGSGGCSSFQTGRWGPFYASHGIVAMIVNTGSSDQPATRGRALLEGIEGFKAENANSSSPLYQKLAGRYGTSGFSMGGGGTTYASRDDPSLLTSVALMAWGPVNSGITVPTLFVCGSSDGTAPCRSHGTPAYNGIADSVPKMIVTVSSGHSGQPSSGGGMEGAWGLAFQKVFLDGDERWKPVLLSGDYDNANIQ